MSESIAPDHSSTQSGDADLHAQVVTVTASDLPLHCPTDKSPLWSLHPRVFLDITKTGEVHCPYCGTHYKVAPGTVFTGHGH